MPHGYPYGKCTTLCPLCASYQYPEQSPISNGSNTIKFASISLTHTANSNISYRSENATKSVSFGAKGNIA
jgi:hypothetical protein